MKRSCIALFSVFLFSIPLAHANTQPTKEGAHSFLTEMASSKRLQQSMLALDDSSRSFRGYRGVPLDNFYSSECKTSYSVKNLLQALGKNGKIDSASQNFDRIIDWSQVSEIQNREIFDSYRTSPQGVVLSSSVAPAVIVTGTVKNNFVVDSEVTAERVAKAMNFLREECDISKSKYGF